MNYYFNKTVKGNFEDIIDKVSKELEKEGFGVLTDIDLKATFKKKLDVDFQNYRILGACNAPYAHKALAAEDKVGTMLPCNVIVQQLDDNSIEIAAVNPIASMQAINNSELKEIADEISEKLKKVINNI
ncbi:DUF302 domain-containing protein [Gillisia sp. CAL575]|uniref:DUF302 domain-containing protein n=1 Tax=Gillisia sp. CAL575 TaxID=985255 RepID=UPI0003A92D17|nr:DUF302 domain-containing protein [Gillisia sp. CAL575]